MEELPEQKLYLAGDFAESSSSKTFDNLNPATGKLLCKVQEATAEDVDRAVESAREGFAEWSSLTGAERGRILFRAAALVRKATSELARLEVLDVGKPYTEASLNDIPSGAESLEYYAGLASNLSGQHFDLGAAQGKALIYTRREPLGICAGLGAWNYPFQTACWKSAPALACGNSMVFKPAELSPLTVLKLAEIYTEAGLPNGVFNVVQGGSKIGRFLTRHPAIAKISLTGQVETGKSVMADAALTLKQVSMELGGKSPLILFEDCDLDQAVSAVMLANFYNQGEVSCNGTRVMVHDNIHGPFMKRLFARMENIRIGDPMDPAINMGALISQAHRARVLNYVETGVEEGARRHVFGQLPTDEELAGGFFMQPVIFDQCDDSMSIVREEIFGPVMTILTFSSEEEAVRRANDTPYGLGAGVFTQELARAHRVSAQLQAGVCWINNYNLTPAQMPFGGFKQSGVGKENGWAAINSYSQIKSIYVELGKIDCPY